jgi:probable F420-dependent oxidoreductase
VLAAYLAGLINRLRVLFYATVVPYRHPILQARQIATLDHVSEGRLTVVAGIGWLREEFDALGVPFANRGARTDENPAAVRGLWTQGEFAFDGRHVSFPTVAREPRCFQRPHVPIWIGGEGRHVTRRIVESGTGWGAPIPWPIDKLARRVTQIEQEVAEAGSDPDARHRMVTGRASRVRASPPVRPTGNRS